MLSRKTSRIIASAMLVLALAFLAFAFTHPEAGFPWSNSVTYFICAVYGAVMVLFCLSRPAGNRSRNTRTERTVCPEGMS